VAWNADENWRLVEIDLDEGSTKTSSFRPPKHAILSPEQKIKILQTFASTEVASLCFHMHCQ